MKLIRLLMVVFGIPTAAIGFGMVFLGAFGGSSDFMIIGLALFFIGIYSSMKGTEHNV